MTQEEKEYCYRCPDCNRAVHTWFARDKRRYKCYHCDKHIPMSKVIKTYKPHANRTKKRSFMDMEHISKGINRERILNHIRNIEDGMVQAFWATLYLTGARVSEIITYTSSYKKTVAKKGSRKGTLVPIKLIGLRKFQFEREMIDGHKWMHIKACRVLKTRTRSRSRRTVSISYEHDGQFIYYIDNYLKYLQAEEPLFNFSRVQGWKIINIPSAGGLGIFPHLLRALRALDLRRYYGWRLEDIVAFIGWQSYETAKFYLKLDTSDLVDATRFDLVDKARGDDLKDENPCNT